MVNIREAVGKKKLEEIKLSAREEVGFNPDPQPYESNIQGKTCGHEGCDWSVPEEVYRTDGHELENNQHGSLLQHLRDEHNGKLPFEVDNSE